VVHLVQHHQRPAGAGPRPVQRGRRRHLRIRDHRAAEVARCGAVGVAEGRVQRDAEHRGRGRPLRLEVLGRGDHADCGDRPVGEQLGRDPQREGGLAGARRRDREEVGRPAQQVRRQRAALPGPQRRD
jgi:hypothetical protein